LFEQHCRGVGVILNMKKPSRIFSLIIFKLRCLLLKKSKHLWKRRPRSQTLWAKYQAKITFLAKIVTRFANRKVAGWDIKMQNMGTKLQRGKRTFLHRRYR
jgi:hypothetical protein